MASAYSKRKTRLRYGGYDEYFVDVVPERLMCSICTKVLKDPHLMACCGQKYCNSCLQAWFKTFKGEVCPHCRATRRNQRLVLHILDKGLKSEVESLHTLCPYFRDGCEWKGELRDLKPHLRNKCDYVMIECPNHCQSSLGTDTKLRRKNLSLHLTHCKSIDDRDQDVDQTRNKVADLSTLFSCISCEY